MSAHTHTWGSKGRAPRKGDYCLTCPQSWSPRVSGYLADGYKPRTRPHTPTPKPEEAA